MINRINPDKPIVSNNELRRWLQAAKQTKSVAKLYKIDNVLKNTEGFRKYGLLEFIKRYHGYSTNIQRTIRMTGDIFKKYSLIETASIDYWGHKV